jgi:hypothetical protein
MAAPRDIMSILAGLYGFKPTDTFQGCRYSGDVQAGQSKWGHIQNALQTLHDVNRLDLQVLSHTVYFDDGVVVTAHRSFGQYSADVYVPVVKGLKEGEFYWVPGCVARYDAVKNAKNCIPSGVLAGEKMSVAGNDEGTGVGSYPRSNYSLQPTGSSPGGLLARVYNVIVLPGNEPNTTAADTNSGLIFSSAHIPSDGPFSISCLVRLNKKVVYDHSFSEKTNELNCGYTIWNPMKPHVLYSTDGEEWGNLCPGSIAPLIGSLIPSRFSDHWVRMTNPWPVFNSNFVNVDRSIGYREITNPCSDAPALESEYAANSPYWDKIATGTLEILDGKFLDFWAENTEIQNAMPYASYCTFKVVGEHRKSNGTRVVGTLKDGAKRYATVTAIAYEFAADGVTVISTMYTLKDHQYKLYLSDAEPTITFGNQPFPVAVPNGYLCGINFLGMMLYDDNRIMAGKLCDFQTEYTLPLIVSDRLTLGEFYHVCMTYETSGKSNLYIANVNDKVITRIEKQQSKSTFLNISETGSALNIYSGLELWRSAPSGASATSDWVSSWVFSASIDMALPRFYHRGISKTEAALLARELISGVYVADDYETSQLMAAGFTPVTV